MAHQDKDTQAWIRWFEREFGSKAPQFVTPPDCPKCHIDGALFDRMCRALRKAEPTKCMVTEGVEATLARVIAERDALRERLGVYRGAEIARALGFRVEGGS